MESPLQKTVTIKEQIILYKKGLEKKERKKIKRKCKSTQHK